MKLWVGLLLMKVVFARCGIGDVVSKPDMLAGAMVDHQIYHQIKIFGQVLNVGPIAQVCTHPFVVDHGKPIVRGRREKRQNMNAAYHPIEIGTRELRQCLQRHRVGPLHTVAVANQNRLGAGRCQSGFVLFRQRARSLARHFPQVLMHALALGRAIQLNQVRHHLIVDCLNIDMGRRNSGWVGRPVQRQSLFGNRCEALSSRARASLQKVRDESGLVGPSHCPVSPRSVFRSMPRNTRSNPYPWASFVALRVANTPVFGANACRA